MLAARTPSHTRPHMQLSYINPLSNHLTKVRFHQPVRQDAVDAGCRMLFLPECFSFIGESQAEVSHTWQCCVRAP